MKNSILFVAVLMLVAVPFSSANARHGFRGGGSSSISIGVNGGSGTFYYSQQNYSRSINNFQRTVIRVGNGGYYGGHQSVYYGGGYYGSGRQNHIHRQEGRRYVNDVPCMPVVVVPVTNRHHRHYRGCGCRY